MDTTITVRTMPILERDKMFSSKLHEKQRLDPFDRIPVYLTVPTPSRAERFSMPLTVQALR